MAKFLLTCILALVAISNSQACGPNESYNECGSMCPDYCGKPEGIMCPAVCVPGCFCNPGYIIGWNGTCIPAPCPPPPPECGEHQVYDDCGPRCPDYCGKLGGEFCAQVCTPGCVCEEGYIFSGLFLNRCIPVDECEA